MALSNMFNKKIGEFHSCTRNSVRTVLQPKRGSVVIVKDSPDAVKAMKNVFMRLCTTTNEMISAAWPTKKWRRERLEQ